MDKSDIENILTGIVTPVDWSNNKDLQMAYIVARDVAKAAIDAYKSKLSEQKPIGYLHANGISFLSSRRTTAEQARAEDYNIPLYAHPMAAIKQEPIAWVFEDELPSNYPYELMFEYSKVDGVRMFPVYAPKYTGE